MTAVTATSGRKILCRPAEDHLFLFRKDLDFVPEPPNNNEAGAAGGAQPLPDKKKKKDKVNLKPKLNYNPHNVTGSYFGSKRQKEDEEVRGHLLTSSLPDI